MHSQSRVVRDRTGLLKFLNQENTTLALSPPNKDAVMYTQFWTKD